MAPWNVLCNVGQAGSIRGHHFWLRDDNDVGIWQGCSLLLMRKHFWEKAVPVTVRFCNKDCLVPWKGSISVSYKPVICCQLDITTSLLICWRYWSMCMFNVLALLLTLLIDVYVQCAGTFAGVTDRCVCSMCWHFCWRYWSICMFNVLALLLALLIDVYVQCAGADPFNRLSFFPELQIDFITNWQWAKFFFPNDFLYICKYASLFSF